MGYFKGGYPPLIGGVSQQVYHARASNQVSEQVNMLSDIVTGPRRRGGFRLVRELPVQPNDAATEVVTLGAREVLLCVECSTGRLRVFSLDDSSEVLLDATHAYLVAEKTTSIRFVQHGNDVYALNTERTVQLGEAEQELAANPNTLGYFYVNAGALSTTFNVAIDRDGLTYSVSHKTPDENAELATPEHIATQLRTLLENHDTVGTTNGYVYTQLGPYVFVQANTLVRVSSTLGTHMVQVSNSSNVKDVSALPAKLPRVAGGYIVRIGYDKVASYYVWDYADAAWKERAAWGERKALENLPVYINAESMQLNQLQTPGRLAGNTENSPDPAFVGEKLTGLGSFQGRLLLMQGENLTFSASNDPSRLYRASMSKLDDDDPIEMSSTTTLGVKYEYALPHNGDLLITSETVQGLIPGRTVLTPKTAVVSIAAQYKMQPGVQPRSTGKSVLYPAASSLGTSALWEMTPSEYTEQQVTAHNITEHLPSYIRGKVRGMSTSNTSGIAVILDDSQSIKVHQYLWDGTSKKHSAFHEWNTREHILSVHMQTNLLYIIAAAGQTLRVLEWDIVSGLGDEWKSVPKLDSYVRLQATTGTVIVPKWMFPLEDLESGAVLAYGLSAHGTPYPYRIGLWAAAGDNYVGRSEYIVAGPITLGYTYESKLTPTTPVVRDFQGAAVLTERAVLRSVTAICHNTGSLKVNVSDRARKFPEAEYTPLRMYSNDLDAGLPLATTGPVQVPMRTDLQSTVFTFSTTDIYDMNITAIEFDYRHNRKGQRTYIGGSE